MSDLVRQLSERSTEGAEAGKVGAAVGQPTRPAAAAGAEVPAAAAGAGREEPAAALAAPTAGAPPNL
jgi:hypothetical protein